MSKSRTSMTVSWRSQSVGVEEVGVRGSGGERRNGGDDEWMEAALGTRYDVTIEFENTAYIKSRADRGGHKTMKSSHLFLHIEFSGAAADGRTGTTTYFGEGMRSVVAVNLTAGEAGAVDRRRISISIRPQGQGTEDEDEGGGRMGGEGKGIRRRVIGTTAKSGVSISSVERGIFSSAMLGAGRMVRPERRERSEDASQDSNKREKALRQGMVSTILRTRKEGRWEEGKKEGREGHAYVLPGGWMGGWMGGWGDMACFGRASKSSDEERAGPIAVILGSDDATELKHKNRQAQGRKGTSRKMPMEAWDGFKFAPGGQAKRKARESGTKHKL
ncbi:hypothetical protein B0H14DRAFT_3141426 [Mycena olivaceomarginata]|nr:hypothetical protein B0H14DRAFT_3141426 [Mycena olivaceomarginata]